MESLKLLVSLVGGHVLPEEADGPAPRTRVVLQAARAVGRDRFSAFVARVGRRLASGRLTLVPEREA